MKKIIVIISIFLFVIITYFLMQDKKTYLLFISEGNIDINKISNHFKNKEEEIIFKDNTLFLNEWISMIHNNEAIFKKKRHTIQNALIKADITIIDIGLNDISFITSKNNNIDIYNGLDNLAVEIEEFISLVKSYTKEKVVLVIDNDYLYLRLESILKPYKVILLKKEELYKIYN